MVEDEQVRGAASGVIPDADIISAWQADFEQKKQAAVVGGRITLTLPSGIQIRAMRLPLILLLQSKSIPDKLSRIVNDFIRTIETGGGNEAKIAAELEATFKDNALEAAQDWLAMLNFVFINCVTTPNFVEKEEDINPEQGIFWIDTVNFYDKLWLFQWAQGVDQSVQQFLDQQAASVGTLSDEQGVRMSPQQLLAGGDFGRFVVSVADRPSDVDVGSVRPSKNRRNARSAAAKEQATNTDSPEVHTQADHGFVNRADDVVPAGRIE